MALINRSIPGLFGGVSQQIPALRHPTQCEEEVNAIATLTDGLTTRPAIEHILRVEPSAAGGATIAGIGEILFVHPIDQGAGGRFWLAVGTSSMMVYDMTTGTAQAVVFTDGLGYLASADPSRDIRAVTVADHTFILNRSVSVALAGTKSPARPINRALIYVKQAVAATTYRMQIDGTTVSYTSDASPTVDEIVDGLVAASSGLAGTHSVTRLGTRPVIVATRSNGAATAATVSDSFGNTLIKAVHDYVEQYADLPANLSNLTGVVTRVASSPSTTKGAYWVTWNVAAQEYRECSAPSLQGTLDATTLPHKLVRTANKTWQFSRIYDWDAREAGDEESNPLPSFVGRPINDIFFHRNRLGLLTDDSVALSKAGRYYTFFGDSAQQVLDTDPIDLDNPVINAVPLQWAVAFDDVLLVTSSKHQLKLLGGDILSPKSARLVQASAYDMDTLARPEPLGSKCLFLSSADSAYSSVWELLIDGTSETMRANEIAEHLPKYFPAGMRKIAASPTAKMALMVSGEANTAYLYRYEEDAKGEKKQRSWRRLSRAPGVTAAGTNRLLNAHWVGDKLYLFTVFRDARDDSLVPRHCLEAMRFSDEPDAGLPFQLRLDRKWLATGMIEDPAGNTMVKVPYVEDGPLTAVSVDPTTGTPIPLVQLGNANVRAGGITQMTFAGNHTAKRVYIGRRISFKYTFSEVVFRDSNDAPMEHISLALKRVTVKFSKTGPFKATVTLPFRPPFVYSFLAETIGMSPTLLRQDGTFTIPVGAPAAEARVSLETDSWYPATFPYAEWLGQVIAKSQR